ncbi:MAG: DUF4405 domain-containing protein [Anaerolineae bacterium]|nr:DUF4405 domain-containing protein [Anaerolineae bacterium]
MNGKNRFNFWLDLSALLGFIITALTGLLLWLVLPHGRGSDYLTFLSLTRSTWVDIHDWVGLGTLIILGVHIVIHWKWIKVVGQRYFTKVAHQSRLNFSLNSLLFTVFFLVNLSGLVAWLILPAGGFQGGRNPYYGVTWFGLDHHVWNDIHRTGVAMISVAALHIVLHWHWIMLTAKRYAASMMMPAYKNSTRPEPV